MKEAFSKTFNITKKITKKTIDITKKVINSAGEVTGNVTKTVVKATGASDETAEKAEKIAKKVGKMATGGAVAVIAGHALIASAAGVGLAGATVTTSGLAGLGGTMVGGILVVQALAVGGAIAAGLVPDKEKRNVWDKKNIKSGHTTYKDGQVKMFMQLNKNKDGLVKGYTRDGLLKFEATIKEGKPYGVVKHYYNNGLLRAELWEENGYKHGLINFYNENSQIVEDMTLEKYQEQFGDEYEEFKKQDD